MQGSETPPTTVSVYARPRFTRAWLFQDFRVNRYRPRIQTMLVLFRFAQAARWPFDARPKLLSYPVTFGYTLLSEWVLGMELPVKTSVGSQLQIAHGFGLVVNVDTKVGSNVTLRQNVTMGNRGDGGSSPVLCDGVDVGANAVIIGPVTVGAQAKIGAGAVVLCNVPPRAVAVGNPARIIEPRDGSL